MNVFELFATLGLDTSSYDKGLDQSESKASSFGAKLKTGLGVAAGVATTAIAATTAATVAGGKAFVDGAKQTAAYGDKIDKASQKLGMSKKAYQELDYVMNLAGTSMDNMGMGMKTLTNQISAAQKGNKDAVKNFKALGISMDDIKTMSQEDLFKKTIAGLQNMEAGTKRSAMANKLFGRSGQELQPLLNMTSDQMEKAIKTANDYGMVLSDKGVEASANFTDSMTTLKNTMTGVKNNMMAEFLPSLTSVTDGLAGIFSGVDTEEGEKKIWYGISTLAEKLTKEAPKLFEIGGTIIKALASSVTTNLPTLLDAAVPVIMDLAGALISNLPPLIDAGVKIIGTIADALTTNLPAILTAAQDIIIKLAQAIGENADQIVPAIVQVVLTIVEAFTNPDFMTNLLDAGLQIINGLLNGIITAIPMLIESLPTIIDNIVNGLLEGLPLILEAGTKILMALIDAIPVILDALMTNLPKIIDSIMKLILDGLPIILKASINLFMALIKALPTIIKALTQNLPQIITTIVSTLIKHLPDIIKGAVQLFMGIIQAIPQIIKELGKQMPDIIKSIVTGLKNGIKDITKIGGDLIRGLWKGISDMSKWIGEKIKGFGKGVTDKLKKFFGISSPSKLFRDEIGHWLAVGLGEGFEDGMDETVSGMTAKAADISQDVADAMSNPLSDFEINGNYNVKGTASGTGASNSPSVINATFNIYGAEGQDIRQLAKEVSQEIQNLINDKEKVYA